jgi:hypothetical protein
MLGMVRTTLCNFGALRFLFFFVNMALFRLTSAMKPSKGYQMKSGSSGIHMVTRKRYTSLLMSAHERSEIAIYSGADEEMKKALNILSTMRPHLEVVYRANERNEKKQDAVIWSAHSDSLQVDCTLLEPMFLGKKQLSEEVTAEKWDQMLDQRTSTLGSPSSKEMKGETD